jgi:hypothetical protein
MESAAEQTRRRESYQACSSESIEFYRISNGTRLLVQEKDIDENGYL